MKNVFTRIRQLNDSGSANLGDFNVSVRRSHEGKHVIVSMHGKETKNQKQSIHAAFYPDRMKEFYFRVRFELEHINNLTDLEKEYQDWILEVEKLVKEASDEISEKSEQVSV